MVKLGVNIDHAATLRQARGGKKPDPVHAAVMAEMAGADGITAHLREDRRHIQDRDIYLLKQTVSTGLNLEMAPVHEIIQIALDITPRMVTIVPEKREEVTTEAGLQVRGKESELSRIISSFHERNILVSLFINPDIREIKAAAKTGATHVELHTGTYANAEGRLKSDELAKLQDAAFAGNKLNLHVNAGHGLDYQNTLPVAQLEFIEELNIGHSILSRSILTGLESAVKEMKAILYKAS